MNGPVPSLKVERRATTLRELALDKMREAILNSHFHPGERLVERALCVELGVSRTVVREVLRHLETEGLIDNVPHQGPVVATLDAQTAQQIYEIRALLEGDAAMACAHNARPALVSKLALCISRIERAFSLQDHRTVLEQTGAFYECMFEGGGKSVAWEIVQTLNARINRLRALTIATDDRGSQAVAEMNRILDAIRAHDGPGAQAAAHAHVQRVAEIIARQIEDTAVQVPLPDGSIGGAIGGEEQTH
ncbi:GntR family transcriptional regulator [Paraburkholderia phosphatilytica]|uniref:GntR family transcriptional regulator n=1 Tax=Paraburkholderia phosphatilytica TaxID=2282883 RepID=UPI000E4F4F58|nr:GntR family transcriptional regulator [Paraburkholderia phosphatilytica]